MREVGLFTVLYKMCSLFIKALPPSVHEGCEMMQQIGFTKVLNFDYRIRHISTFQSTHRSPTSNKPHQHNAGQTTHSGQEISYRCKVLRLQIEFVDVELGSPAVLFHKYCADRALVSKPGVLSQRTLTACGGMAAGVGQVAIFIEFLFEARSRM